MVNECVELFRLGDLLHENLAFVLHPLDGHFDVILLAGLLEGGLRQSVAFRIEGIPLAVGIDAVATLP